MLQPDKTSPARKVLVVRGMKIQGSIPENVEGTASLPCASHALQLG